MAHYYLAHASVRNEIRYPNSGDYGEDILGGIVNSLTEIARDPPLDAASGSSVDANRWKTWLSQDKSKLLLLAVDQNLRDSRLHCFARKVEWGFPNAIIDLATLGGKQTAPTLRKLAQVSDKKEAVVSFESVRGRVQTALAILGDSDQFIAIVHELDTLDFGDAVTKLRAIGGKSAVSALMNGFDNPNFLADRPDYTADKEHIGGIVDDHDGAIASALTKMVVSPPDTSGSPESKSIWKDWWARSKDTARFVRRPVYE